MATQGLPVKGPIHRASTATDGGGTQHAFEVLKVSGGIAFRSAFVNSLAVTNADGSTVATIGTAYKYYVNVTVSTAGVATAATLQRTETTIPTDTATAAYQIIVEVDTAGNPTSKHVFSSLRHAKCGAEHQFGGLS